MVHKGIITKNSTFFEAACSERWQKSGSEPIRLPDDDPDVFEMYLDALYRGEVRFSEIDDSVGESGGLFEKDPAVARLMCMWIVTDKLGDERITKLVMDCLHENCPDQFEPLLIAHLYERTSNGSELRRFIVENFVSHTPPATMQLVAHDDATPKAFLSELLTEKASRDMACGSDYIGCKACLVSCTHRVPTANLGAVHTASAASRRVVTSFLR